MKIEVNANGWLMIDFGFLEINCSGRQEGEYPFGWFDVNFYYFHPTTKIVKRLIFTKPVLGDNSNPPF
jgi:hypothetical protein